MQKLLPIGSIVILKNAVRSLLIVGREIKDKNGQIYDYIAVSFPEGYIDKDTFFVFNIDKINKVVFSGYTNQESELYETIKEKIKSGAIDDFMKGSK